MRPAQPLHRWLAFVLVALLLLPTQAIGLSPTSSERWSSRFVPNGRFETVHAAAYDGQTLFAEGTSIVLDYPNEVASWRGGTWTGHGGLANRRVTEFAFVGGEVFACGTFASFDGLGARYISRWDGEVWTPLGTGVDDHVLDVHEWKGELYAAGEFMVAGGQPAHHIAKWDGTSWSALGGGLPGTVYDLASDDSSLYAISDGKIAVWNGTSWSWLAPGEIHPFEIEVYENKLYLAGYDDSITVYRLGGPSYWEEVADGLVVDSGTLLRGFVVAGDRLYLAESESALSGPSSARLSSYDGESWEVVSDEFTDAIWALSSHGKDLVVAGAFDAIGDVAAPRIAKWDGNRWKGLGFTGGVAPTGDVEALTVHDGQLYAGGSFDAVGDVAAHGIAKWDGRDWAGMGGGTNGTVRALSWIEGFLYAGGTFSKAGGVSASGIAKWDGASWSALGGGLRTESGSSGFVLALAAWKGALYAAGLIATADGSAANGIAKWDGQAWAPVGEGLSGQVNALAPLGDHLYAAVFGSALQRWDGAAWADVEALEGSVSSMIEVEQGLLIAGTLRKAGDTEWTSLVLFDGEAVSYWPAPLPDGVSARSMATSGSDVFLAGWKGDPFLARWDGAQWTSLSSSVAGTPRAVAATDKDLFVGGFLWRAGRRKAQGLAKFCFAETCETCGDVNGDEILAASDALGVLRAAVGVTECALLVCDFNGDAGVSASDALGVLQASVGIPVPGLCGSG